MIKRISYSIIVLLLILMPGVKAQECPKIRVGVNIKEVYPEVFDYLNKTNNTEKHRAVWMAELSAILMDCLRENSPELDFIYLSANPGADYDYLFTSLIALTGGGEDVIVVPEYSIITGDDDIFTVPPIYGSEYTVYSVWSSLIVNSNCYPSRRYILWIDHGESQDIYRAILSSLFGFSSSLTRMLYERENLRPVPPRDPNIETWIDKEYLSPLDQETRKARIYEKVLSCNWQPSYYYDYHSQPVRFPAKTDRGEIWPVEGCKLEYSDSEIQYILVNKQGNAVGEYTLLKGLDPLVEKITLSTCPLGNKPNIEKEIEIIIRGLELEVEPERKVIHNGEHTSIQIDLHELDPDGTEILSCAGKEVDVKVTGLVDGTVSHSSGMITLNEVGVAYIEYKAGQKDRQIKITATFTPPKYPEELKAEATITVKPLDYEATLTIKGSYTNDESDSYERKDHDGTEKGNYTMRERQEASFYVPLKLENSGDMPLLNQRWEYYRPIDVTLISFSVSHRMRRYEYSNYGGYGHESTTIRTMNPLNRQIPEKEYLLQSNIILIIDKETDKVVKIATGGFPVAFQWDDTEKTTGRRWNPDGSKPINESSHKTDEMFTTFSASAVEDPVPDPTFTGISSSLRTYLKDLGTPLPANIEIPEDKEEMPETEPDLLVKFGDGTTFFGGEGKKVIDDSKGSSMRRKEMTFRWQVTRKKKP